jgi:hypothetical protein
MKIFSTGFGNPRKRGARVAIVLYYLFTKNAREVFVQVISRNHMLTPLSTGAGMVQCGVIISSKIVFLPGKIFKITSNP